MLATALRPWYNRSIKETAEKKGEQLMDDTAKKETLEEAKKGEKKIELTDEEAEKIAGGASFGFYDREKRKPK